MPFITLAFLSALCSSTLHAQVVWVEQDDLTDAVNGAATDKPIDYFVGGFQYRAPSDLAPDADLALFLHHTQVEGDYIDRVYLLDNNLSPIATRSLKVNEKIANEMPPYIIFDRLVLNPSHEYTILVRRNVDGVGYVHNKLVFQPVKSTFPGPRIPEEIASNFDFFKGVTSSPFRYFTRNSMKHHGARGGVASISEDGDFSIFVQLMHQDANDDHFTRTIVVTDPVGRMLGFTTRSALQPVEAVWDGIPAVEVNPLTPTQIESLQLTSADIGRINDCPYIMIFVEDVFDAMTRSKIHLR